MIRPTIEVAGGLRGAPIELTKCKTCDIEVPATSEFVIEFEVIWTKDRDGRPARRIAPATTRRHR